MSILRLKDPSSIILKSAHQMFVVRVYSIRLIETLIKQRLIINILHTFRHIKLSEHRPLILLIIFTV